MDNTLSLGGPVAPPAPEQSKALPEQTMAAASGLALPQQGQEPPLAPSGLMTHLGSAQDKAAAQYAKMQEVDKKIEVTKTQLDGLSALADTVTQDDVVKAASKLVAAGVGSVQVATLLADMPPDGQALQAWVSAQDQKLTKAQGQVQMALKISRHQMGVAALRNVIGHSAEGHQKRLASARLAAMNSNALAPQAAPQETSNV